MTFVAERQEWERRYWRRLLKKHGGHIAKVARESGYCRQQIYVVLRRLGMRLEKRWCGNEEWQALSPTGGRRNDEVDSGRDNVGSG